MKQSNSTLKKIDIYWSVFSIVFISISIFYWQTGIDSFILFLFLAFGLLGLLFSIRQLMSKTLFNVLRVLFSLGMLYYILKFNGIIETCL